MTPTLLAVTATTSTGLSGTPSPLSVPVAAATCGALAGLGLWILIATLRGHTLLPARLARTRSRGDDTAGVRAWLPTPAMRIGAGAGLLAGAAGAATLRLPVLAILAAGVVAVAVETSRGPSVTALNAQGAAVAAWCESVRQELDAGQPMLAALVAAADMPPAGLEGPLARLSERLQTGTVPEALWAFASEVRYPAAGQTVAALEIAYRHGAGDLPRLMARQVETTRHQVQTLRELHAARARHRRSMILLLGLFMTVIGGLFVVWPDFLDAYRDLQGQLVLAAIGGAVLASVRALARMSAPRIPPDFFTQAPEHTLNVPGDLTTDLTRSAALTADLTTAPSHPVAGAANRFTRSRSLT